MVFTSLHLLKAEQMNYRNFKRMSSNFFIVVSFVKADDWRIFFFLPRPVCESGPPGWYSDVLTITPLQKLANSKYTTETDHLETILVL